MLLRRIKQHVENENWFSVFVDFVIVVVGVYVGIEVANWNEQRQEDQRGLEYMERLKADFESDLRIISYRLSFWEQVLEHGRNALAHAEKGELVEGSAAQTALAYFQASQVSPYQTVNVTYQEMVAAGDLNLIHSSKLRAELADLQAEVLGSTSSRSLRNIDLDALKQVRETEQKCYVVIQEKIVLSRECQNIVIVSFQRFHQYDL